MTKVRISLLQPGECQTDIRAVFYSNFSGELYMLFLASVKHSARECLGLKSARFKDFVQKFSPEYLANANVKLLAGCIDHACLTGETVLDHWTTFVLDSDSAERVISAFSPIPLELRNVIS